MIETIETMRTFSPRPRDIERRWYVIDAEGAVLGRLASEVAKILRGKHKPIFAPHADTGDHVIVVNARGIRVTGGKEAEKVYYRHSGYPGGLREIGYERLLAERPVMAVEKAIRGMLPKNRLGRQMFRKLSVYEGPEHPHQAQTPSALGIGEVPRWEGLPKPVPPKAPAAERPAARTSTEEREAVPPRRTSPKGKADRPSGRRTAAKAGAAKASGARGKATKSSGTKTQKTRKTATAKAKATGAAGTKKRSRPTKES
jgi:large subunit ribosomal protein L13